MHVVVLAVSAILVALVALYVLWLILGAGPSGEVQREALKADGVVYLPLPEELTGVSVEEVILLRRSVREYAPDPIKLKHLAMILWAAYGITDPRGFRASPSAGATYPLEVYAVVGEKRVLLEDGTYLRAGVYKYDVHRHLLALVKAGDVRRELAAAALGQEWVEEAPASLVVCAVFERTVSRYGERGRVRYVPMEVGHLGQNVYLMATALGYGTVVVGAFHDDRVRAVIGAPLEEEPMYVIPMGVPKEPRRIGFDEVWRYIEARRGG